jgi:hypothetical protein
MYTQFHNICRPFRLPELLPLHTPRNRTNVYDWETEETPADVFQHHKQVYICVREICGFACIDFIDIILYVIVAWGTYWCMNFKLNEIYC